MGLKPVIGTRLIGQLPQALQQVIENAVGQLQAGGEFQMALAQRFTVFPPLCRVPILSNGIERVGDARQRRHHDQHPFTFRPTLGNAGTDLVPSRLGGNTGTAKLEDNPSRRRCCAKCVHSWLPTGHERGHVAVQHDKSRDAMPDAFRRGAF